MYVTDGDVPCKNHDPELWFAERDDSRKTAQAKGVVRPVS